MILADHSRGNSRALTHSSCFCWPLVMIALRWEFFAAGGWVLLLHHISRPTATYSFGHIPDGDDFGMANLVHGACRLSPAM